MILTKKLPALISVRFCALLLLVVAFGGCSSSSDEHVDLRHTASPYGNVDLSNTRNAPSSLKAANIANLTLAWSRSVKGEGNGNDLIGSPVVAGGAAYLQGPTSNVEAFDLESGETLWERHYGVPTRGSNGVIVAGGRIFGATPTSAFALDAKTGDELWTVELVRNSSERIGMTPGFHNGTVYLSTLPIGAKAGGVGVLWALDAKTGKKLWHFDTVPRELWGHPDINSGGGLSQPPAFDGEGSMYIGTGNPSPAPGTKRYPWGSSRPGPNLYTTSIVKLDEKTGKVSWHYQVTPHALCNWDVGSPIIAESHGRKLVLAASLGGIVVALDRRTGKLVWRRPVGLHNGHDDDGLVAMRGEYGKLDMPMTVYPGVDGGVGAPMSLDGTTVFVPVINNPTRLTSQVSATFLRKPSGELVAIDVATGRVRWKKHFPAPLFGPTLTTNDLVFATSLDGIVFAIDAENGEEEWSQKLPSYAEGGLTAVGNTLLVRDSYSGGDVAPRLLAYRLEG